VAENLEHRVLKFRRFYRQQLLQKTSVWIPQFCKLSVTRPHVLVLARIAVATSTVIHKERAHALLLVAERTLVSEFTPPCPLPMNTGLLLLPLLPPLSSFDPRLPDRAPNKFLQL
jgi:hypothetical protein